MKKLLTLIALLMATTNIYADYFTVDGLGYETDGTSLKLIYIENATCTSVTIPARVWYNNKFYDVTDIGAEAFYVLPSLSSVTFSSAINLKTIGPAAFYGCTSLSAINIPKSVTLIDENAFVGCIGLSSITFEGNACQNAIDLNAFLQVGTKENPATLILPNDWGNDYLPLDNKTPWHGGYFNSNRYQIPIDQLKSEAKNDIDEAMGEYKSNKYLLSVIADELNAIDNATSKATIDTNKEAAIAKITPAVTAFQEVKASALGTMGTEQAGPAVKVTKGDDTIILYGPDKVEFIKAETEK